MIHHGRHAENKKVVKVQALYGYNVNKHIHKLTWRLNTIITLDFKHFFNSLSLSVPLNRPNIQKGTYFRRETEQDRGMHSVFSSHFFFLLSLCFFSLPRRNVYFSSLRERLGGSGPDLGAHNSPGPASLMKFKLTAA